MWWPGGESPSERARDNAPPAALATEPAHRLAYCSENLRITSRLRSSGSTSSAAG